MTWQEELKANLHFFTGTKNYWTPEEMQMAYRIWNGANSERFGTRVDTGCSSCRRTIVQGCIKLAEQYVK
jgi:hypothetical protein